MSKYECKKAYVSYYPEEGYHLVWYDNSFFPSDCKEYDFADWVEATIADELCLEEPELAPGLYSTSFDLSCDYDQYTGETDIELLWDDFVLVEGWACLNLF